MADADPVDRVEVLLVDVPFDPKVVGLREPQAVRSASANKQVKRTTFRIFN